MTIVVSSIRTSIGRPACSSMFELLENVGHDKLRLWVCRYQFKEFQTKPNLPTLSCHCNQLCSCSLRILLQNLQMLQCQNIVQFDSVLMRASGSNSSAHCCGESTSLIPSLTLAYESMKHSAEVAPHIQRARKWFVDKHHHVPSDLSVSQGSKTRKLSVLPEIFHVSGSASKPKGLKARSPNLQKSQAQR